MGIRRSKNVPQIIPIEETSHDISIGIIGDNHDEMYQIINLFIENKNFTKGQCEIYNKYYQGVIKYRDKNICLTIKVPPLFIYGCGSSRYNRYVGWDAIILAYDPTNHGSAKNMTDVIKEIDKYGSFRYQLLAEYNCNPIESWPILRLLLCGQNYLLKNESIFATLPMDIIRYILFIIYQLWNYSLKKTRYNIENPDIPSKTISIITGYNIEHVFMKIIDKVTNIDSYNI